MPTSPLPANPKALARWAGLGYLAIIGLGIFAQVAVRGQLIDWSDATLTAEAVQSQEGLLRLGILADVAVFTLDIMLAVIFYRLLAPVDRGLALFAFAVRITMTAVLCANLLNEIAPLVLLGDNTVAAGLNPASAAATTLTYLRLHNEGYFLGLMLFGVHGACLGILLFRSGYFPRFIGLLACLSGLSYVAMGIVHFGVPALAGMAGLLMLPAALPEFIIAGWLVSAGLNRSKWDARLAS